MTAFHITAATSVFTSTFGQDAFASDSAGADSLIVDAGAFLIANGGNSASGAVLAPTGVWTVTVNGDIFSTGAEGINLVPGNTGLSSITVGAEGSVGGSYAILLGSSASLRNFGSVAGELIGVEIAGAGSRNLTNSGTIQGGLAVADIDGLSNDTLTNAGGITGTVSLNGGTDSVINGGRITGDVLLGAGADSYVGIAKVSGVTVNGSVTGTIDLGAGDDRMTGGTSAERVSDGDGTDTIVLGGGNDTYIATGQTGADGIDTIQGGSGIDTFDGSTATSGLLINLDTVAHDLSPFSPGANALAAGTAMGMQSGTDRLSGFENARGGATGDTIYGSGAANRIEGNGGTDILFGYGGNDRLEGGASFDNLIGGSGRDLLIGGADADSFTFLSISDSGNTAATRDTILDFEDFRDVIALDLIDARPDTAGDDAFAFIGTNVAFGGHAGELRAVWTASGQMVQGDVTGDGVADFSIAVLDATHSIIFTSLDFVL